MAPPVTQRDVMDTITALHVAARDLSIAACMEPPDCCPRGVVLVSKKAVRQHVKFLKAAAEELRRLIVEEALTVPSESGDASVGAGHRSPTSRPLAGELAGES